jgi:hypothetical protein
MSILRAQADLKIMHDEAKRTDVGLAVSEYVDARKHRIQVTRVWRKPDHIIDFQRDLGPQDRFTNPNPTFIIGSVDLTDPDLVGTLWDMAEDERNDTGLVDFLLERSARSTLIEDAVRAEEQKIEFIKRNPVSVQALKGAT